MKAPAKPGGHLEQTFPKMSSPGTQSRGTGHFRLLNQGCRPRGKGASSGRPEARFQQLSPNEGAAEALAVGWWCPVTSAQAATVGGEGIQSRRGLEALSRMERKRRTALTSSVYWTSSMAYFSLKCSLEWILKGKHRNARVRVWLPSRAQAQAVRPPAHPCPADTWYYTGLPNTDSGKSALGRRVITEPHLPPRPPQAVLQPSFESMTPGRLGQAAADKPPPSPPVRAHQAASQHTSPFGA